MHISLYSTYRLRSYAMKAKSCAYISHNHITSVHKFLNYVTSPCECILNLFVHRSEKEKSKFQAEVYELLAQVENVTKEKITISKTVERCEITISELHIKIEELNRTIVDITSHKQRLSQENIELIKEVQDLKVCKIIIISNNSLYFGQVHSF